MNIGLLIEETLTKKGLEKKWLADKMNINYKTFTGKFYRNSFEAVELIKIAKILKIDLNELKEEV